MRPLRSACAFGVLLGVFLFAPTTAAFYCGGRVVAIGDPQFKVQQVCGPPDAQEWRLSYRVRSFPDLGSGVPVTVYEPVAIEVWRYNFGPRRFVQELVFEEGRVSAIQPLGYGYE